MALARIASPLAVAGLAASLLVPAAAGAKSVDATNITVTRDIGCFVTAYGKPEIECSASFLPSRELDPFLAVRRHGAARKGERGDYPGHGDPKVRRVHAGDLWVRAGVSCVIGHASVVCRNRDGHGFRLQKGRTRLF